jgi:RHS repeat-associated protein
LIQAVEGSNVIGEYVYNGNGQRIKKYTDNGTRCIIYHYDQNGLLIAESTSTGTIKVEYIYLNGSPLAKIEDNNIYFYHNDHLGTPVLMTDESSSVVWEGEFLPFGEPLSVTGSITNNLRFPGQYYDSETGLHYNYFRDYSPLLGRYLQADPIGFKGGMNLYNYVGGNPIINVDIFGLKVIGGINCKEIGRRQIPVINPGEPYRTYDAGFVWICTDIVIEDTFSCVCIYEKNKKTVELYERYVAYEVTYKCKDKNGCDVIIKKNEIERIADYKKYIYTQTGYFKYIHGTVTAAFGGCSACLEGIGQIIY